MRSGELAILLSQIWLMPWIYWNKPLQMPMIQWATILLEGLLLKALSQIKRMRPNWIHWPGLNQPVPRHDFHKVVDLHQLFMVPDEGIIHPNVEHHILSRFFFKIPRFRSEIWLFNGENQKIIEKLPYYAILSFCWRHHHSKSGVVLIIDRGLPKTVPPIPPPQTSRCTGHG